MTSELSDHVGYEDDFVGFLYVPPELQQGRHDEWVVWLEEEESSVGFPDKSDPSQMCAFSSQVCYSRPPIPRRPAWGPNTLHQSQLVGPRRC